VSTATLKALKLFLAHDECSNLGVSAAARQLVEALHWMGLGHTSANTARHGPCLQLFRARYRGALQRLETTPLSSSCCSSIAVATPLHPRFAKGQWQMISDLS